MTRNEGDNGYESTPGQARSDWLKEESMVDIYDFEVSVVKPVND